MEWKYFHPVFLKNNRMLARMLSNASIEKSKQPHSCDKRCHFQPLTPFRRYRVKFEFLCSAGKSYLAFSTRRWPHTAVQCTRRNKSSSLGHVELSRGGLGHTSYYQWQLSAVAALRCGREEETAKTDRDRQRIGIDLMTACQGIRAAVVTVILVGEWPRCFLVGSRPLRFVPWPMTPTWSKFRFFFLIGLKKLKFVDWWCESITFMPRIWFNFREHYIACE